MTRMKNDGEKEAESPNDTSPAEKEEGVNEENDDKNEKKDGEGENKFPDDTSPVEMEEYVNDRNDDYNENNNQ